jgi:hypothetical protein
MYFRRLITKELLREEMHLASKKNISFKSFLNALKNDYILTPVENPEFLKALECHYDTLLFMVHERKNRYSLCG